MGKRDGVISWTDMFHIAPHYKIEKRAGRDSKAQTRRAK